MVAVGQIVFAFVKYIASLKIKLSSEEGGGGGKKKKSY